MYIVFDAIENEFEFVHTEKQAKDKAEEFLQLYRDEAPDNGWPEDIVDTISYAKIIVSSKVTKIDKFSHVDKEPWPYAFDEIWYVDLVPVKNMVKEK